MTKQDCQRMLSKIGFKLGVSPRLISERLLSKDDKMDMLNGVLDFEAAVIAVQVWKEHGMPDYVNGK